MDKAKGMLGKFSNRIVAGKGTEEVQPSQYAAPVRQGAVYAEEERQPQAAPENPVYHNPFRGDSDNDYGGRTVYVSKRDRERMQQQAQQQMQQTGQFAPAQQQMQQSGRYAPVHQQMQQISRFAPVQQGAPQMQQPQQQMQQGVQPGYSQNAPAGNVVPFPGTQQGTEAPVYNHVEYILFLHGYNQVRNIIDFIKASASVFLSMEFIASESERQRCVDFLSGAVYALGCTLNRISPASIYLISPPTVKVVPDPYAQRLAKAPEMRGYVQQRYDQADRRAQGEAQQQYSQQAQQPQPQRPQMQHRPQMQDYATQAPQQTGQFAPVQQQAQPAQQPVSYTKRFAALGTQRNQPVTYASAMGGVNAGYGEHKRPN